MEIITRWYWKLDPEFPTTVQYGRWEIQCALLRDDGCWSLPLSGQTRYTHNPPKEYCLPYGAEWVTLESMLGEICPEHSPWLTERIHTIPPAPMNNYF